MYIWCKFCGKFDKNYSGYCQRCYTYFVREHKENFKDLLEYGVLHTVDDEGSKQYGMPICHICGNAYTKLQQHIFYVHNISKKEYCKMFGLDNKVVMTSPSYHKKMREYAYKYNMDEQVKEIGKETRFKKGQNNNYERSYMTMQRLKKYGKEMGYKNLKNFSNKA